MAEEISFEQVLRELSRTEELEKQNAHLQKQVDEQAKAIDELKKSSDEVKEKAGIEESGKEKNVIGSEKLPATLTTSERRRYQNIGKEFIDGAGDQFQKILKGVKFKSMMSTMKEKFTAGIDKIKGFVKKAKEKKWFFAKLILIATLLGVIIHHFKEKIMNVIPNLGEYISQLFKKGRMWVSESISEMMDWVKNKMADFISEALRQTFSYMKSAVTTFFTYTLPDAIVNLYLSILSAFSDDASQQLISDEDKIALREQAANQAEEAEEKIEFQQKSDNDDGEYIRSVYNELKSSAQVDDFKLRQLQNEIGVLQFSEKRADTALFEELESLTKGSGYEIKNINELIKQSKFDPTKFLNLIDGVREGGITRQEAYAALKEAITDGDISSKMQKYVQDNGEKNKNSLISASNTLIAMATDAKNKVKEIENKKNSFEEETKKAQQKAKEKMTSIDAAKIIQDELQDALKSLVDAITNFLNDNKISESITTALNVTNDNFQSFFDKCKIFIENSFQSVDKFFNEQHSYLLSVYGKLYDIVDKVLTSDQKEEIKWKELNDKVPSTFNIGVSVFFPENGKQNGVFQLVHDVAAIDLELNKTIETANGHLSEVINALNGISIVTETKDQLNLQKVEDVIGELKENDQKLGGEISKINTILESLGKANNAASDPAAESAVGLD